ncbi:hypothetical protein Tco_1069829 [Tanacetum coccineum]|uniref:Uncharacterized protein n=1 Tax=Tanacetum coccineum TaxID=301880 RepID=A0ABQ5HJN4_9ASTR
MSTRFISKVHHDLRIDQPSSSSSVLNQNIKLEKEKAAAEAEAALLSAQPTFPKWDLKKYVEELEIEVPDDLKVLPEKIEELKILDAIPSLLNKLTEAPDMFANAIESSQKTSVAGVPLVGRANSHSRPS